MHVDAHQLLTSFLTHSHEQQISFHEDATRTVRDHAGLAAQRAGP
jgi:hypothetical protein